MRENKIKIFIGFDTRERVAFHVLSHSIYSRASSPVSITPLILSQLEPLLWRNRSPLQSTDFAFSRFLVPYLCDFDGWAIFMDCDMLVLDDISNLWDLRNKEYAVQVVKHDHKPSENKKFLGQAQLQYEKKNWSSVMLFNCTKCQRLDLEYINSASGLELHRFRWLENESLIGDLPKSWNHLAGYDPNHPISDISNIHFTSGGPYYNEYQSTQYASVWFEERNAMLHCEQLNKELHTPKEQNK